MVVPVRYTITKRREWGHKKHDVKCFCCLRSNDGDGKMYFKGCRTRVMWFKVWRQKEE
ncbi:hypothetical protein AVEN_39913-1, partial [Araneus ventricosus]